MDDEQAIRQLKVGQIEALGVLVQRYQTVAIETAYLITHDLPLAEDVVQDVFLQVYRSIATFDPARPFRPYLLRSVVNAAVRAARRARRNLTLTSTLGSEQREVEATLDDLLCDPTLGPDDRVEQTELTASVEAALWRLPPEQRAAIVLRYFLDLSDEEIARKLACAPGTVRWRLHVGRNQLRVWLSRLAPERPSTR